MNKIFKLILYSIAVSVTVRALKTTKLNSININIWSTHISPEIVNELKDFENLIPMATIDEIVAKHYLIDGNFRTAFKYLRSEEFTQLQKQALKIPEIVDILEFLHLTAENATMRKHIDTTAVLRVIESKASFENDNNDMTTKTDIASNSLHNINSTQNAKGVYDNKKTVNRRPQMQLTMDSVDDGSTNAVTSSFNVKQPLVRIVLLDNSVVKTNSYDVVYNESRHHSHHQYRHKYRPQLNNNYHHHEIYYTLGTFTAFVEEVLQHLPHAAYQNMIKEKCQRNSKFAEFYQALRSQDFKPLVEQALQTSNIKNVVKTLNAHDVNVSELKPIAFQVISWGPNI